AGDAIGVAWIVAGNGVKDDGAIFRAASYRPHMIERPAQGNDAMAADTPIGWLETGGATAGRGNTDRATSISADGPQAHAGYDSRRRAATGTARHAAFVPRIVRLRRIRSIRKFVSVGLA